MGGEQAGGRRAKYKNSCNGKLSEKIHTQRVAQKKSSCIRKKIYSYKGNVNKNIRAARKSSPPHLNNFCNGPSLSINLTLCVLPKNVWESPCTVWHTKEFDSLGFF